MSEAGTQQGKVWVVLLVAMGVLVAGTAGLIQFWVRTARPRGVGPQKLMFAPAFSATALDGTSYRLIDLRGEVVVLNFFMVACGSCGKASAELGKAFEREKGRVVFLGIAAGESRESLAAYARAHPLAYPLIPDDSGEVARMYQVSSAPTTFMIGGDGRIYNIVTGAMAADTVLSLVQAIPGAPWNLDVSRQFAEW